MSSLALSFDANPALLEEAIGALRISRKIVQKLADHPGHFRIDGSDPLTSGQVVALAWDTGLIVRSEES